MKTMNNRVKNFLTNRDETGRFVVKSLRTGKVYFVEPIHNGDIVKWGDIDPAAKKLRGSYGQKFTGAIKEKESIIKSENGFDKIATVPGSPFWEIERRDRIYLESV